MRFKLGTEAATKETSGQMQNIEVQRTSRVVRLAPKIITYAIVIILSLSITSVLIAVLGHNPGDVYRVLFTGAFGSTNAWAASLTRANPILLCSLGLVVAYRCGVWNIGAEGQLLLGAIFGFMTGYFTNFPAPLELILMFLAGWGGGMLWGLIPTILRVRFKTNILITTLLMNFIALWLIYWAVRFPFKSYKAMGIAITDPINTSAQLPRLITGTNFHVGFIVSIALVVGVWYLLNKTVFGYRNNAVGSNAVAARYAGIPVNKVVIISMIISGGLAGLGGMMEVSGVQRILQQSISADYGYLAIAMTFIGMQNPFGVAISSIFFGGLLVGARAAQATLGLPITVIYVFLGLWMGTLLVAPVIEGQIAKLMKRRRVEVTAEVVQKI